MSESKLEKDAKKLIKSVLNKSFGQKVSDEKLATAARELVESIPPYPVRSEEDAEAA